MTLTIAGALTGPLMTRPTPTQLAAARGGAPMTTVGAHTVGAADGGPGIPVTGWSRRYGDIRVPHFVGLHAVQALALVALLLGRWRAPEGVKVGALLAAAVSYATLFVFLLLEALRGQSVVESDAARLVPLAIWGVLTALVLNRIAAGSRRVLAP
jgi:hypothetical protein